MNTTMNTATKSTPEHLTYENQSVSFCHQGKSITLFPEYIESCMNPGTYKLYPVECFLENNFILSIKSLKASYTVHLSPDELTLHSYEPPIPKRHGCLGDCQKCGKC